MKKIFQMDDWYEKEMPNKATLPLFEAAADAKIGFILGTPNLHRKEGASTLQYLLIRMGK